MNKKKNNPRRSFIKKSALAATAINLSGVFWESEAKTMAKVIELNSDKPASAQKTVALIANIYRNSAHADVIATKIFAGIPTDDGMVAPQIKIVSVWIDQIGDNDTGVQIAGMNGAKMYDTIAGALTLGGDKLAVDAVIYVGEHGEYDKSRYGIKMYPRMNYLEQIFRVFDASNKSVPLFNDKHLSYSWLDSKWVYDRSKELNVPMMAGSSLPFCWRDKPLEHPLGVKITEAVAIGYHSLDSYGFHVAEILQCMVERREGGETGVSSVLGLSGGDVWKAIDDGRINIDLVNAACDTIQGRKEGNMRDLVEDPNAIIVEYTDGTKGAIVMLSGYVNQSWAYAADTAQGQVATEFVLDHSMSYSHFSYLTLNIQKFIVTGKPTAPVERTLLTSGISDMGIRSLVDGKKIETPFLDIKYSAAGFEPIRPTAPRPEGQSIGPWPPKGYEFIIPERFKK